MSSLTQRSSRRSASYGWQAAKQRYDDIGDEPFRPLRTLRPLREAWVRFPHAKDAKGAKETHRIGIYSNH